MEIQYPKYYNVRYTSEIIAGSDFFENLDPANPHNLNLTDQSSEDHVEIKVEKFETLVASLARTSEIILELETPVHGWVEIMLYYYDEENPGHGNESFYIYFQYNPEIGL